MGQAVDQAFEGLRKMVASGRLKPGDRLPSELELCEELDVSRSSLREAQRMLQVCGVIRSAPGSRSYVSQLSASDFMAGLRVAVPLLPLEDYLGLYDMRAVLEAHAASLGAARFSDEEIDRLDRLSQQMAAMDWSTDCESMDEQFHSLLVSGARSEAISALLEILRRRGRHYRIFSHDVDGEIKTASDVGHARIVEALRARDPATAATEATHHIRTTRHWLESIQPQPEIDG